MSIPGIWSKGLKARIVWLEIYMCIAENEFSCLSYGRKYFGKSACYQHFLLLPQCIQKASAFKCLDCVVQDYHFATQSRILASLKEKTFTRKHCGKRRFLTFSPFHTMIFTLNKDLNHCLTLYSIDTSTHINASTTDNF